jgi:hypothetical protein
MSGRNQAPYHVKTVPTDTASRPAGDVRSEVAVRDGFAEHVS